MTQQNIRSGFEHWILGEYPAISLERYSDEILGGWAGHYKLLEVQMAWEAWAHLYILEGDAQCIHCGVLKNE